jgi:hypothetical protein
MPDALVHSERNSVPFTDQVITLCLHSNWIGAAKGIIYQRPL